MSCQPQVSPLQVSAPQSRACAADPHQRCEVTNPMLSWALCRTQSVAREWRHSRLLTSHSFCPPNKQLNLADINWQQIGKETCLSNVAVWVRKPHSMGQIHRSIDRPQRSKQSQNTTKTNPSPVIFKTRGSDTNAYSILTHGWTIHVSKHSGHFMAKKTAVKGAKFPSII